MYLSHSVSVSLARVRDWGRYRAVDQNQTKKVDFLWRFSSLQDCVSHRKLLLSRWVLLHVSLWPIFVPSTPLLLSRDCISKGFYGWCNNYCVIATPERIGLNDPFHQQNANFSCHILCFEADKSDLRYSREKGKFVTPMIEEHYVSF